MRLTSITPIQKVLPTNGSQPVVVYCNDDNEYVCKYDSIPKLFNEYIAASFLRVWGIPVPDFSLVQIGREHIPSQFISNRLQPSHFLKPCFGSRYLPYANDITAIFNIMMKNDYSQRKIHNKQDFLRIALFDLWVANTDRNANNHNLLFNPEPHGNVIYAIDHSDIFDCCRLGNELAPLTFDDSILSADFAPEMLDSGKNLSVVVNDICKGFYLCAELCEQNVVTIMEEVPKEWNLEVDSTVEMIRDAIFHNKDWLTECETLFRQYVTEAQR